MGRFSIKGHNKQVLDKLEKQIKSEAVSYLHFSFNEIAEWVLKNIEAYREFEGFTGNTQRSYCVGFYYKGKLEWVEDLHNVWSRTTIRKKIWKGDEVYLDNPYEGEPRTVIGEVYVSDETGFAASLAFLRSYKPKAEYELVVCTGTEYSKYLEDVRGLNVLTETFRNTKIVAYSLFIPHIRNYPF